MVLRRLSWGAIVSDEPVIDPSACAMLERIEAMEVEMRAALEREAQATRAEAHAQGLREGREEAIRRLAVRAIDAGEQARALQSYVVRAIEAGLLSVFGALPRQVAIPAMIGRALAQVDLPGKLLMRVNPNDLDGARQALERVEADPGRILIVADAGLPAGGCRLESDHGSIDAGLDVQLRTLLEVLVEAAGHASAPEDCLGAPT
jgi:flagellar biosynthesis/type III secretory pathway protein FliH